MIESFPFLGPPPGRKEGILSCTSRTKRHWKCMTLSADGGASFILLGILVLILTPGSLLSAVLRSALLSQSLPLLNTFLEKIRVSLT